MGQTVLGVSVGPGGAVRPSVEVPAEVHLDAADLRSTEGEDLGVAKARAVDPRRLVGDDDLVPAGDQALELEGLELAGVGPAALEVALAVDRDVGGTRE